MECCRCCIFLHLCFFFFDELNLACDESELSLMQLTFNFNETMNKKTERKISTEGDLTRLYVDSLDNVVLCKRMFDGFYKFTHLYIEANNVEEIEADFLHGQQIYKSLHIVNGRIKIIKQNTFKNLMVMTVGLHENEITTIEREAFVNLSRLEEISLGKNKITRLSPDGFIKLPRLNNFDVSNNRISKVQKEFFEFLKNESVLICLQYNAIDVVDDEAFVGSTTKNVQIDLGHNYIKFVPCGFFQGRRFGGVDLTHNKISNFSEDFLRKKVDIEFLDLSFNPLEEGTLEEMTTWAKHNDVDLVCPNHSDGVCSEISVALEIAALIFTQFILIIQCQ
jgi:Leucine-rich repeat (LRR) protein